MTTVWIKLYIGKDDDNPATIFIEKFHGNIYQLKEKIKEKKPNALKDFDADELDVYRARTRVPPPEGTAFIDPGDSINSYTNTTSRTPLIVIVDKTKNKVNQRSQEQKHQAGRDVAAELQALRLEVHGVRETLPSVLVGHVITPSQASRIPQVVASVFDSLGLSHNPRKTDSEYVLPQLCGDDWKLSWKWPKDYGDDRSLERTSYHPVAEYLKKLGFVCVDVSEGQCCVEKLLFNADIFTSREDNPMRVRGQRVYLRHRIQGRTDLAVLRRDNHGGYILRNMIKFVVEIKTVYGYQQSQTGCMREAQLQVIGLNAFNTHSSPPVVLSNLAKTHKVVYLDVDSEWRYEIKVQDCNSFAAAIHFADTLSNRKCISQHFSRPTTPDSSD